MTETPSPTLVPLERLHPAPWNPRVITDPRFQNLCQSLLADPAFLWHRPVLAQADGTIYAGNQRYRAAQHLGLAGVREEDSEPDAAQANYSRRITPPIYQPTGPVPPVAALYDDAKTQTLLTAIAAAALPDDVRSFLVVAAQRHTVLRFGAIAEFYAHAPAPLQALMEASALVIIDFHQAIEHGFVALTEQVAAQVADEYGA